jgi:hypothetical protein
VALISASMRNALFALALVVQTIAGGTGVVAAAAGQDATSVACDHNEARRADAPAAPAKHHCGACALCSVQHAFGPALAAPFSDVLILPAHSTARAERPGDEFGARAEAATAHQPRAPPAA